MEVANVDTIHDRLDDAGYSTVEPGALGEALQPDPLIAIGNADDAVPPAVPVGYGRYTLLAAMDESGRVALSATGPNLLQRQILLTRCGRTPGRSPRL